MFSYDAIGALETKEKSEVKDSQGFRELLQPPELVGTAMYV